MLKLNEGGAELSLYSPTFERSLDYDAVSAVAEE